MAKAVGESSSLLLSKCVNSHSVLWSFRTKDTSTYVSEVTLHPLALRSLDFPPLRAIRRLPATPILPENAQLCYHTRMQIWEEDQPKSQKRNIIIVLVLGLILTFPVVPWLLYRYGIEDPARTSKEVTLEIEQGASVAEIANDLKDLGLINSPALFKIYLKLNGLGQNIQAGVYVIPPMTNMVELVDILQYGRNDVTIRYVEGWRVEQLGELLSRKLENINYTDFVSEARDHEGFLFPDTYYIKADAEQEEVLKLLRDTFEEKTAHIFTPESLRRTGLSAEEIVILASIVEREVAEHEDRRIVAGILLKRLREGMGLEADATTQYAVALNKFCVPAQCRSDDAVCDLDPSVAACETGLDKDLLDGIEWWPRQLTNYDLNFNSPYNTRTVAGLPPTPISSVSVSALEAVVDFEPTDYYFYMTGSDGATRYSEDLDGHVENMNNHL